MDKKSWITIIILIALPILLSACNGNRETTPTPIAAQVITSIPTTTTEQLVEAVESPVADTYTEVNPNGQVITYWHPYSGAQQAALEEITNQFNASNPWGILAVPEYQGNQEEIFEKLLTFMNTGEMPNLVLITQDQAATLQLANLLIDIAPLVYSPGWGLEPTEIADFFPSIFFQDISLFFDHTRLGFAVDRAMDVLYYNADWLTELGYAAPPASPDEFTQIACEATHQPFSGATAEGSIGYQWQRDSSDFASFTFAFGGQIFDPSSGSYIYDNPVAMETAQFIQNVFSQGCANIQSDPGGEMIGFAQGTTLFTIGSTSDLSNYQSLVAAEANFDWKIAPIPHTTLEPVQNIHGPSLSILKKTLESELASWLFVQHFTDPEVQNRWIQVAVSFPVRASAISGLNPDLLARLNGDPLTLLQYAITEPSLPGYSDVQGLVSQVVVDLAGGAEIESTLSQLTAQANTILQQQETIKPASPDPWAEIDPSGQIVLFWHPYSGNRQIAIDEIVRRFNITNRWGITVIAEFQGSLAEIEEKMHTALENQTLPNLVVADQNQVAAYQKSNNPLTDLTSLIESVRWGLSADERADFFPAIYMQDIYPSFGGARLGFPTHRSMEVIYYNKDRLAELGHNSPPITPADFEQIVCAASSEDNPAFRFSIAAATFSSWVFAFGGEIFDPGNNQYSFDNPATITALSFLQSLVDKDCAGIIEGNEREDFYAGNLLFLQGSSNNLPDYLPSIENKLTENGVAFELGITALPHTTINPAPNISGPSLSLPQNAPEAQLAAWLFLEYFASPEAQTLWAQSTYDLPVRASVAADLTDFFAANPAYAAAFNLLTYGKTEPTGANYATVANLVEAAMIEIFTGGDVTEILTQLTIDANLIE
jgi:multiple sugar transport system substrate-binding protein